MSKTVSCPTCKRTIEWRKDNPSRPFCSERCKLIDLGQWANETYRVEDKQGLTEHYREWSDGGEDSN